MGLHAGKLSKRVTIQTHTDVPDGGGGTVKDWIDTVTVWARVEPLDGSERFQAQQVTSSLSHRVTIRHRSVTPQQRIKFGSRILRINAVVNPNERGEMLQILCEEENI